ncbi:MAG: phosphate signaling complex protein PhoU [Oscillospiraceae bacterium]|nr:phosphate signaling complex protein PhoU [Oscillospiraceae bacterium]
MRNEFVKGLAVLKRQLTAMNGMVEKAVIASVGYLIEGDRSCFSSVHTLEKQINKMEKEIEHICTRLLIFQQPLIADDYKEVLCAQKMVVDLERIGDNAEDIVNIAERLHGKDMIREYGIIPEMSRETIRLVKLSLQAFLTRDISLIEHMEEYDDVIDRMLDEVKSEIAAIILKNPAAIDVGLDVLLIAKYFEKIADHAVNIAGHVMGMG